MSPIEFCYWLQGYIEIGKPTAMGWNQVQTIKEHLALVFHKVTPAYDIGYMPEYTLTSNSLPTKKCCGDEIGYSKSNGVEMGYQYLNTAFTGVSSGILC